jgi:hypothetical protein
MWKAGLNVFIRGANRCAEGPAFRVRVRRPRARFERIRTGHPPLEWRRRAQALKKRAALDQLREDASEGKTQ